MNEKYYAIINNFLNIYKANLLVAKAFFHLPLGSNLHCFMDNGIMSPIMLQSKDGHLCTEDIGMFSF